MISVVPTLADVEDLRAFRDSVRGILADVWPDARVAGSADVRSTLHSAWDLAAGHGWLDLAQEGSFDALFVVIGELGRTGCPLPVLDANLAGVLLAADAGTSAAIRAGAIRPVVLQLTRERTTARCVEAADVATHALVLSPLADGALVALREISTAQATPGLARPRFSDVELAPEASSTTHVDRETAGMTTSLLALAYTARACAAATRTAELAIDHAKNRTAFGKPIGAFQAVSHRAADAATELTATRLLIDDAVAGLERRSDWHLSSALAVEFGTGAASRAQFGAQHTLAATGYFEEHEAPWLFRRVHCDVAAAHAIHLPDGQIADLLVEGGRSMPALNLGERADDFRAEVQRFLEPFDNGRAVTHLDQDDPQLTAAAIEAGYLTMSWPTSIGGGARDAVEQAVMGEELAYRRLPLRSKTAADMLGRAIARHGTAEQQARLLPLIAAGEMRFYLGYSEPEVGSDLASMRTRAERDGADWVVTGQKLWGTGADTAEWVWLAARTDPLAQPRHAGITVFLTRTNRAGFTRQPHVALSGEISCTTFFDEYRIPDTDRVGEINGGWAVITEALAHERVIMAGAAAEVLRLLDDLLAELRTDPARLAGARGSAVRQRINSLAARTQAARTLVAASVSATSGGGGRLEAAMAKISATQLMEDFCVAAIEILGPTAILGEGVDAVPGRGAFEYGLRMSIMQVIGGGTIDIQRNLVARGLGLPQ